MIRYFRLCLTALALAVGIAATVPTLLPASVTSALPVALREDAADALIVNSNNLYCVSQPGWYKVSIHVTDNSGVGQYHNITVFDANAAHTLVYLSVWLPAFGTGYARGFSPASQGGPPGATRDTTNPNLTYYWYTVYSAPCSSLH